MLSRWELPREAVLEGTHYPFHGDFRDVLEIMTYLEDPGLPEFIRWQVALALFYKEPVREEHAQAAMEYLAWFLSGGETERRRPGPKLLDWQQDAGAIIADVNKVAGQEIRSLPFLHWWTFLGYFHAIGQGQLSMLVQLRDKLRRGKKLEGYEKEFYRENKERVELKKKYSPQELEEQQRLMKLLDGA